jgi:hypothetical protein
MPFPTLTIPQRKAAVKNFHAFALYFSGIRFSSVVLFDIFVVV